MHTLAALLTVIVGLTVIGGQYCRRAYDIPQHIGVVVGSLVCLALMSGAVSVFQFGTGVGLWLVGLATLWLVRSATAVRPFIAMSTACWMIASVLVAALLVSRLDLGMWALAGLGVANSIVGILQRRFRVLNPDKSHNYAIGFCGNENYLGNFLVGTITAGVWVSLSQPVMWIGVGLMLYCLWLTRCKTAMVGLGVGTLTVGVLFGHGVGEYVMLGLLTLGLLAWPYKAKVLTHIGSFGTFRERLNYWRIGWEQVKATPMIGLGFDCVRTEVPFVQRMLNQRTGGEFLKFENYECPYPRKLHNDYIQHMTDNGLVGLMAVLGLVGYVLWQVSHLSLTPQSSVMLSGFVGLAVCGLGFHTWHRPQTHFTWWFFLLGLASLGGQTVSLQPEYALVGLVLMTFLMVETVYKDLLVGWYEAKYFRTNGTFRPDQALVLRPTNSFLFAHLCKEAAARGNQNAAFYFARTALENYDGEQRIWVLYLNLSSTLMMGGSFGLGKDCAVQALSFLPSFADAQRQLNQCTTIMENIQNAGQFTTHSQQKAA